MQPPEARLRVLDTTVLDCDDRSPPGILHIDSGMPAAPARVAVVVPEVRPGGEREDEPRDGALPAATRRGRQSCGCEACELPTAQADPLA